MHALFFDVRPRPGHMPHYFEHVARLKPVLARHAGLVYLDRFTPRDAPGALLSHQLWADAGAIAAWRADPTHRASQAAGRRVHFEDYRIRVGVEVAAPEGPGRYVVAAYGTGLDATAGARLHDSVTTEGARLALTACTDPEATRAARAAAAAAGAREIRVFAILRDYTMTDRAEAPAP